MSWWNSWTNLRLAAASPSAGLRYQRGLSSFFPSALTVANNTKWPLLKPESPHSYFNDFITIPLEVGVLKNYASFFFFEYLQQNILVKFFG
jgi:hypothetical protein